MKLPLPNNFKSEIYYTLKNNEIDSIEKINNELLYLISSIKTFGNNEDIYEYLKNTTTTHTFKQIYNILTQKDPLPEPAFYGYVYILSEDSD